MDIKLELSSQAACKMLLHAIRHPHAICSGLLLSPTASQDNGDDGSQAKVIRISEAIPMSHASHALSSGVEIAMNCVERYAVDNKLVISGYYQANRTNEPEPIDVFEQRIVEKIGETFPNAILCRVSFEGEQARPSLEIHSLIDGKLKRKSPQNLELDEELSVLEKVVFSPERLHRGIIDFDDHFNDISTDWTNAKVSQKIDELLVNL